MTLKGDPLLQQNMHNFCGISDYDVIIVFIPDICLRSRNLTKM